MKKTFITLISLIFLLFVFVTHVQASNNISFPKQYRGTWYNYDNSEYFSSFNKIVISKNKMYSYSAMKDKETKKTDVHKGYSYLHKNRKHKRSGVSQKTINKYINWMTRDFVKNVHGYNWMHTYGWMQVAGAGEYYNVHKFKNRQVLTAASSANVIVDGHYYHSKKIAKKLESKKYKGFLY
ncbi:hypothetical protein [Apilactobacillus xinyiensis]|uniref:hypothetical protein n=1 Tax=Apilactobacillus xinyiensis TaxID=2841032 RepID=UPI001C7D94AD|nr:hypothetical protein [Apilactobacillus xinyiensis]MCL0319474.1 hypothetical protein [Apilactobacillus xinyiensis]